MIHAEEGESIGAYHVHILFGSSHSQFVSAQKLWLTLHQLRDDKIIDQVSRKTPYTKKKKKSIVLCLYIYFFFYFF